MARPKGGAKAIITNICYDGATGKCLFFAESERYLADLKNLESNKSQTFSLQGSTHKLMCLHPYGCLEALPTVLMSSFTFIGRKRPL